MIDRGIHNHLQTLISLKMCLQTFYSNTEIIVLPFQIYNCFYVTYNDSRWVYFYFYDSSNLSDCLSIFIDKCSGITTKNIKRMEENMGKNAHCKEQQIKIN